MKLWLLCIVILIIVSNIAIATPPTITCDERVDNKTLYENIVLSNNIVKQLGDTLGFQSITVSGCFVGGRLQISINYKLPTNFSSYGIAYTDVLSLSYMKNGTIEMGEYRYATGNYYETLDYERAIEKFKERVTEIESDARIREFITKTKPTSADLTDSNARISVTDGWIEYSWYSNVVRDYFVPNSIEWENFPEIKKSHEIVETEVLPSLPNCSIAVDSGTGLNFYDGEGNPMYMTVTLDCYDGRREAWITLNTDGTHLVQRVENFTVTRTDPLGLTLSERAWIDSALALAVLIAIPSIIIWLVVRRKKIGKRMNT